MGEEPNTDESQNDSTESEKEFDENQDLVYITDKVPFIRDEYNYLIERAIIPFIAFITFGYIMFTSANQLEVIYNIGGVGVISTFIYMIIHMVGWLDISEGENNQRSMNAEQVEEENRKTNPALLMGCLELIWGVFIGTIYVFILSLMSLVLPPLCETLLNMGELNTLGDVLEYLLEIELAHQSA